MSRILFALTFAWALFFMVPATAHAVDCSNPVIITQADLDRGVRYDIDQPGCYVIQDDLHSVTTDDCIKVVASDVLITGGGSLSGPTSDHSMGIRVSSGSSNVTIENLTLNWGPGATVYEHCLLVEGNHCVVRNITVHGVAVGNSGDYNTFENLKIFDGGDGAESGLRVNGTGIIIRNNLIQLDNQFDMGLIRLTNSTDALIEGNTLIATNARDKVAFIRNYASHNTIIRNNYMEGAGGPDCPTTDPFITIRSWSTNVLLENNTIISSGRPLQVTRCYAGQSQTFRNNIFIWGTGANPPTRFGGILLGEQSTDTYWEGNLIIGPVGNSVSAYVFQVDNYEVPNHKFVNNTIIGLGPQIVFDVRAQTGDVGTLQLYNNIFYTENERFLTYNSESDGVSVLSDHNLWWRADGGPYFEYPDGTDYDNLAEFRSGTGNGLHSIQAAPNFRNFTGDQYGDYSLADDSPARDTGSSAYIRDLGDFPVDLNGDPRIVGSEIDMGAYEHQGDGGGGPTGACCLGGGSCVVLTEALCASLGGEYQGDGAVCDPGICGEPPDVTPPATVGDLAATLDGSSIDLSWTAVGDDGESGQATTYDLRYADAAVTSANWTQATRVNGEPDPGPAGHLESLTLDNLPPGTYYFGLKVGDEVPNWSGISNSPFVEVPGGDAPDTTAPAAVTDLATGVSTESEIPLTWTAVGDDSLEGQAAAYDLRYATVPITPANFAMAARVWETGAPQTAGAAESYTVGDLAPGTTYYLAMKVEDEAGNWSGLSNVAEGTTLPATVPDTTPPAAPGDFTVETGLASSITLSWTAPGDDGMQGRASSYQLRYSTEGEVTEANWASLTEVALPPPAPAGRPEQAVVSGLDPTTTYYFGLRAGDEVPNWSPIVATSGTTTETVDYGLEGYGSETTGGAGAPVYSVTTLADSGPGSFRDAVAGSQRDIVFTVSGTIRLQSTVNVLGHQLTIDGATAPDPGITLAPASSFTDGTLLFLDGGDGVHDVIVRHLRLESAPGTGDNLRIKGPDAYNVVVDHCSLREPGDGNIDITDGAHDVTVQWSILGDAAEDNLVRTGTYNVSLHHNLYVHGDRKDPRIRDNSWNVDVVNNVAYDWATEFGLQFTTNGSGNAVKNYFKAGPRSDPSVAFSIDPSAGPVYSTGNVVPPGADATGTTSVRFPAPPVTEFSAEVAYDEVLNGAGAQPRDAADQTLVSDVATGAGADTTPPAAVADLLVASTSTTSANLTWTAVGDDGTSGQASRYDLRYATAPIGPGNWDQATRAAGEPNPKPSGESEAMTVGGLSSGTQYYFALKVADEVSNWSDISNIASGTTHTAEPGDTTPPAPVGDLSVYAVNSNRITLSWTSVGDDGEVGQASTYDLRYSTSPINAGNWSSASRVFGEPAPQPSGRSELFTVGGLRASTTYYFALEVGDEVPNWSDLSNVASGTTTEGNPDDETPPDPIDDLASIEVDWNRARIGWTATGDDGRSGLADSYDLRISGTPITEDTWGDAEPVTSVPSPESPGTPQDTWVEGLDAETTYYLAMKVFDEVGNESGLSNLLTVQTGAEPDTIPPTTISDLGAQPDGPNQIRLSWTAPNDGAQPDVPVADYEIRVNIAPIEEGGTAGETFHLSPGNPGDLEEYVVTNRVPETHYYARVRSVDLAGNWSALSNQAEATTPAVDPPPQDQTPPARVSDLAITGTGANWVGLGWTAPGDDGDEGTARSYEVRFADFQLTDLTWPLGTVVDSVAAPDPAGTAETLQVDDLDPGTHYYFALKTTDFAGNTSGISNVVHTITNFLDDLDPPEPVGDLSAADTTEHSVTLRWTTPVDSVTEGATGDGRIAAYDVRYTIGTLDAQTWDAATSSGGPEPGEPGTPAQWVVENLSPGVAYQMAVRSRDQAGNWSGLSNILRVRTKPGSAPPDTVAPGPVGALSFLPRDPWDGLLTWTATGDDLDEGRAGAYRIRWLSGTADNLPNNEAPGAWESAEPLASPTIPLEAGMPESLEVAGLEQGRFYTFGVRAIDEAGNIGPLAWSPVARMPDTDDNLDPNAIIDLTGEIQDPTTLVLHWTAPADPRPWLDLTSVARYHLRRSAQPLSLVTWDRAEWDTLLTNPIAPGEQEVRSITGLTPGETFYMAVRSEDEAGNLSPLSNVVYFEMPTDTTGGTTPNEPDTVPPSGISTLSGYANGPNVIRLTWLAVGDDGAQGVAQRYEIRRSLQPIDSGGWADADTLADPPTPKAPGTLERYNWQDAEPGVTYYFAIKALDEAGNVSPLSNVIGVALPEQQDSAPPPVPGRLWATWDEENQRVAIGWSPSPAPDLAGYQIERRESGEAEPIVVLDHLTDVGWFDEDVTRGMSYAYSVSARDVSGNLSHRSTEAWVSIPGLDESLVLAVQEIEADPVTPADNHVVVRFSTRAGPDLVGFLVYRQSLATGDTDGQPQSGPDVAEFDLLTRDGVLRGPGPHCFEDAPLPQPGSYKYWIEAVGLTGKKSFLSPVEVVIPDFAGGKISLYPNPVMEGLTLSYSLVEEAPVKIAIYRAEGRAVFKQNVGLVSAGPHTWQWDGRTAAGRRVPAGAYFLDLRSGPSRLTRRFVVIR